MTVKPRTNLMLDGVILGLFLAVLLSGLLLWIGLPSGGAHAGGWRGAGTESAGSDALLGLDRHTVVTLHSWIGLAAGALVAVHLAFHWKWIACQIGRLRPARPAGKRPARACPDAPR